MPSVYSTDMHAWEKVSEILSRGGNPYAETTVLNWPPFWMHVLGLLTKFSAFLHFPLVHTIQCFLIIAESVVAIILYQWLLKYTSKKRAFYSVLIGICLNPAAILLVCQHGNFDVLAGLWILLAVLQMVRFSETENQKYWLWACVCIGLGIYTKTVPFVLIPMLFSGIKKVSFRYILYGICFIFLPVSLGVGLIYLQAPADVMVKVIGYRSIYGWYGFSGLINLQGWWWVNEIYAKWALPVILLIIGYFGLKWYKKPLVSQSEIVKPAFLILFSLPLWGPGYAPQYLYWYLPLAVLLFAISHQSLQRWFITGYCLIALTYLVEYALFESHGAFLVKIMPTEAVRKLSYDWSGQPYQVWMRMPLFLYSLGLFFRLIGRPEHKI